MRFTVYIETGLIGNSPITLTVVTSGSGFSRQWRIRVSQLSCDSMTTGRVICLLLPLLMCIDFIDFVL